MKPIAFERQDPDGAQMLMDIYARGAVMLAYFWKRGFTYGVGREPRTPNHTPIIVEPNGDVTYLF